MARDLRAKAHYHVNVYSGDGTTATAAEYVYRRREDAEDALADARTRAERNDTPFTPEDLQNESARECNDGACIGKDG
jgi:hypothetical protein